MNLCICIHIYKFKKDNLLGAYISSCDPCQDLKPRLPAPGSAPAAGKCHQQKPTCGIPGMIYIHMIDREIQMNDSLFT